MKIAFYQDSPTGNIQGDLKMEYLRDRVTNQRWLQQYSLRKEDEDLTWNSGRKGKDK